MRDRRRYLHWVFEAKKRFGVSVLNYMVTSNHIHLLRQLLCQEPALWITSHGPAFPSQTDSSFARINRDTRELRLDLS
jgi:hypothetical protein